MGYYADLEVEREMFGGEGYEYESYTPPTPEQMRCKIASFVGRKNNDALESSIMAFVERKGFDESLCHPKRLTLAKYNFVWNRRNRFKNFLLKNG